MRYKEYLTSEDWRKVKKKVSYWLGSKCLICGKGKIDTHHKTYKRVFKEDPKTDLVPLCRKHHFAIHNMSREENMNLWNVTNREIRKARKNLNWDQMNRLEKSKWGY